MELKACPICGTVVKIHDSYSMQCFKCGSLFPNAAWNQYLSRAQASEGHDINYQATRQLASEEKDLNARATPSTAKGE